MKHAFIGEGGPSFKLLKQNALQEQGRSCEIVLILRDTVRGLTARPKTKVRKSLGVAPTNPRK